MTMHPVEEFAALLRTQWAAEAGLFRKRGQDELAALMESIAQEVTNEAEAFLDQEMTLDECADLGGYHYSTVQHLVRVGRMPNAGQKGRPRVQRRHVPRKSTGVIPDEDDDQTVRKTDDGGTAEDLVERELLQMEVGLAGSSSRRLGGLDVRRDEGV